ncbi:MAG: hypothetical protein CSA75_02455 [Sorangium cellulosum]|nr:MAG: hypothetical protein CSA75_02455 [Sorangium cellulosum]
MIEKRKHPRKAVQLEAVITTENSSERIAGRVHDISIGGMFFLGAQHLPFGTKATVTILFPQPSGTMNLPAVVRWRREDGVGLQFGLIGAKATHAIICILQER